jgi:phosphate starvation-inducible PhoH-like protein
MGGDGRLPTIVPSTPPPAETQVVVNVPGNNLMAGLLGQRDQLLRLVEAAFPQTAIHVRGTEIALVGPGASAASKVFEELVLLVAKGQVLDPESVQRTIDMVNHDEKPSELLATEILRSAKGNSVRPKTEGQRRYIEAIRDNVITFGIGPAGTGKSWLAVAMAVQALHRNEVERIILTRPAVEAGERLGFLPGDLMAKIDPYLRPLYDALYDMVDPEGAQRLLERNLVEVAPLAFMRGRAQPVDRKVLTPTGWQAIGTLRVGDLVIGSDGLPTPVLGVFPQGPKDVFRVATQDGASTSCCAEHLWWVQTLDDKKHGKPGRVLQTVDMIGSLRHHHQRRYELPVLSAPAQFEPQAVPMDPYAAGLAIGSGHDVEHLHRELAVTGGGATTARPAAAPDPAATIPVPYLFNAVDVRVSILQGLLDGGGGTVVQEADGGVVVFEPSSPGIRDSVTFLVQSLGGTVLDRRGVTSPRVLAEVVPGAPSPRVLADGAHALEIRLPQAIQPFRLARTQEIYERAGGGRPRRMIDSIEPAGRAECVCIQVGAADSLYVTDDFLVTHNTINASFIILDEAQNATQEQMKMFLTRIGFGSKVVVTGDTSQVDVQGGKSGLLGLEKILTGIDGLSWVHLGARDVVRHRIVQDIVNAYDRHPGNGKKRS